MSLMDGLITLMGVRTQANTANAQRKIYYWLPFIFKKYVSTLMSSDWLIDRWHYDWLVWLLPTLTLNEGFQLSIQLHFICKSLQNSTLKRGMLMKFVWFDNFFLSPFPLGTLAAFKLPFTEQLNIQIQVPLLWIFFITWNVFCPHELMEHASFWEQLSSM